MIWNYLLFYWDYLHSLNKTEIAAQTVLQLNSNWRLYLHYDLEYFLMTKPSLYFVCSRKSSPFLPSIYTCFASTTFRDIRIQVLWGPYNPQAQYKMAFRDSPTRSLGNCLLLWLTYFCSFLHRCHCFAQSHLLWSLQGFRNSPCLHRCHYSDSYRIYKENWTDRFTFLHSSSRFWWRSQNQVL